MNDDQPRKTMKARLRKLWGLIPLTIIGVLVISFMLLASSPRMDGIFLKPASAAYTIPADDNFTMTELRFYGYDSAVDTSEGYVFYFTCSGDQGNYWASSAMVKGGSVSKITVSCEWVSAFFTAKGYTSNETNFETKLNLTVWIKNPSNVKTYYYPIDHNSLPFNNYATVISYDITDYVLSAAGTYEFGYELKYYY